MAPKGLFTACEHRFWLRIGLARLTTVRVDDLVLNHDMTLESRQLAAEPQSFATVPEARATRPEATRDASCDGPWPNGFAWGDPWRIGTAAFWVDQCRQADAVDLQLGQSLFEEVVACLLGGWGIPGDIGVAAFQRLRRGDLLEPPIEAAALEAALREPFAVPGRAGRVRYRFARQRAARIAAASSVLAGAVVPSAPVPLRDWLADHVPGVGMKTASWIVRNLVVDAPVAVIDVHVRRAGVGAGFFDPLWQLPRDYHRFETAFVEVARRGDVLPGHLDHTVWSTLASAPRRTRVVLCGNQIGLDD